MVTDEVSLTTLAQKWNGPSYCSPGIGRRGGVAILCSPQQHQNISVWRRDAGGRLITLLLTSFVFFFKYSNTRINLVKIYALTYPTERRIFFQLLRLYLFPNSRLILASDFNTHDGFLDKIGGLALDKIETKSTPKYRTHSLWLEKNLFTTLKSMGLTRGTLVW